MICATVMSPPPPIPVKARNMINCIELPATDAASDPRKKMSSPDSKTVFRDQISESLPYSSWKLVDVLRDVKSSQR